MDRFERTAGQFDPRDARRQAEQFHASRFDAEFTRFLGTIGSTSTETRRAA
jgi:hypothetical protein